jgi:hypothetical protein
VASAAARGLGVVNVVMRDYDLNSIILPVISGVFILIGWTFLFFSFFSR